MIHRLPARGTIRTWVKSQWKLRPLPGHFSVAINTHGQYLRRGAVSEADARQVRRGSPRCRSLQCRSRCSRTRGWYPAEWRDARICPRRPSPLALLAVYPQVSRNRGNRRIVAGLDHFASKRLHGSLAAFGLGWVLGYNLHYLLTPQRQRLALLVGILVSVIDPRHTGHS